MSSNCWIICGNLSSNFCGISPSNTSNRISRSTMWLAIFFYTQDWYDICAKSDARAISPPSVVRANQKLWFPLGPGQDSLQCTPRAKRRHGGRKGCHLPHKQSKTHEHKLAQKHRGSTHTTVVSHSLHPSGSQNHPSWHQTVKPLPGIVWHTHKEHRGWIPWAIVSSGLGFWMHDTTSSSWSNLS